MRVEGWAPEKITAEVERVAMDRLESAAHFIKADAQMRCPVGTISRPMYKSGPHKDQPWTARDAGALRKTIRVVRLKGDPTLNVRVYAGTFIVFYAPIVEFYTPFLRPAFNGQKSNIIGVMERESSPHVQGPAVSTRRSGGAGSVLNWKPDPKRQAFLDEFFASQRK